MSIRNWMELIVREPYDLKLSIFFADWLIEQGEKAKGGWLRFAAGLGYYTDSTNTGETGPSDHYTNALNLLARRRGGTRLKHVGSFAAWQVVPSCVGPTLFSFLDEDAMGRIQTRRIEVCGIEQDVLKLNYTNTASLIGQSYEIAEQIMTEPTWLESAARFFETIRLPKELPSSPV